MAEDGIPEIRSGRRPGHEMPGMRGLCAQVSRRMREELPAPAGQDQPALPVPPLGELLSPLRGPANRPGREARPKMISQVLPAKGRAPSARSGETCPIGLLTWPDARFRAGGRYWDRTSDLLGVNEALSR